MNRCKTNVDNKSKRILNKIIEKVYKEFIDDQELSDDMKKVRLLDIYDKFVPLSNHQASPKHNVPVASTMPTSNANRTTVPHNNQFNLMTKVS